MNWDRVINPARVAAFVVMALSAIGMQSAISHYQIYLRKNSIFAEPIAGQERVLRRIPAETDHFIRVGEDVIESSETVETLGTENYLTRVYAEREPGPDGRRRAVQLHLAYYTGMIDTVPHVPDRCLVGGGMSIVGLTQTVPVPLTGADWRPLENAPGDLAGRVMTTRLSNSHTSAVPGLRVPLPRDLSHEKPLTLRVSEFAGPGGPHLFAGYFFVANGGWVSSAEDVRYLAFDLTTDYAYYLKVQVASSDVASPEELASVAGALLDDLLGEIMTCVPDWSRVERGLWPPDNPKRPKP